MLGFPTKIFGEDRPDHHYPFYPYYDLSQETVIRILYTVNTHVTTTTNGTNTDNNTTVTYRSVDTVFRRKPVFHLNLTVNIYMVRGNFDYLTNINNPNFNFLDDLSGLLVTIRLTIPLRGTLRIRSIIETVPSFRTVLCLGFT